MKRLTLIGLAGSIALAVSGTGASADTPHALCVGGSHCYATIQAALDAADSGATIRIGAGRFAGGVTINDDVHLRGVASSATRITGGGPRRDDRLRERDADRQPGEPHDHRRDDDHEPAGPRLWAGRADLRARLRDGHRPGRRRRGVSRERR